MQDIRREKMNSLIQERKVVTINELRELFPDISLMTIHRDLDALAAAGSITKIHGGARNVRHEQDLAFEFRTKDNLASKIQIAEKAATLVKKESSIFLDSGTTCLALAQQLPNFPMTVITSGPNIAVALAHSSGPSVTMCPGDLNKMNLTVSGHSTLQFLERINIDLAFIGVSGYGKQEGFTCGKESEMLVKRQIISCARKVVILCDTAKFHRLMPFTFAHLEDIDIVVCDDNAPKDFIKAAKAAGVEVV